MGQGMAINIGLNRVDPAHYQGWTGDLVACEFDAKDMAALAKKRGFTARTILTAKATAAAVTKAIEGAAGTLGKGDMLFLSYSGHGGQVPDANSDEDDRLDETWVLYDRQLVDDELYSLWARFAPGVRILVLSDSCHSGTAVREVLRTVRPKALGTELRLPAAATQGMKAMPRDVGQRVYEANQATYDGIQKEVPANDKASVAASVLLLSGCQDNQTSADGQRNGRFTESLLKVWDTGRFSGGGYKTFWKRIVQDMPAWQSPNYFTAGRPSRSFERERPFTP